MASQSKPVNRSRSRILFITVCAMAAAAFAIASLDNGAVPHQFSDNDCFSCHFTIPQEGDTGPLRFTDTISRLCGHCHDMSKEYLTKWTWCQQVTSRYPRICHLTNKAGSPALPATISTGHTRTRLQACVPISSGATSSVKTSVLPATPQTSRSRK